MHVSLSGALEDYGINIQAKAIYQLVLGIRGYIAKALTEELVTRGSYKPYPTKYADCRDSYGNLYPTMRNVALGTQIVWAFSDTFIKAEHKYKRFCVTVAFFDEEQNKRTNLWNGSFLQIGFEGVPTVLVYCPMIRRNPTLHKYEREQFIQADMMRRSLGVNAAKMKTTFVHEFSHNYNFLQWIDVAERINKKNPGSKAPVPTIKYNSPPAKTDTLDDQIKYRRYINDPQEINSLYMEWIHAIQTSFNRLFKGHAEFDIRRIFLTFHDFWLFYWDDEFAPLALRYYASQQTRKKLARRLYGFYVFLCENPGVNAQEAENFARDLMHYDYMRDNKPPKKLEFIVMAKSVKKTNKPKKANTAKTKRNSIAGHTKPKKAGPVKKALKDESRPKITRMGLKRWNGLSKEHQEQYLKDHPTSKYNKIGVKHDDNAETRKPEHTDEHLKTDHDTGGAPSTSAPSENPEKTDGTVEEKGPEDSKPETEPRKPFHQRFREAIGNLKTTLRESAQEGFHEGVNESLQKAIEKPLTKEESKARQEEYKKNPPDKPKDSHDVMAMVVGIAAIAALGALATVAPGAAILVGLQVLDHSPDLMRAFSERQNTRREKNDRDWDDYDKKRQEFEDEDEEYRRRGNNKSKRVQEDADEDTADLIGDTVQKHMNDLDVTDKDYFKKRIADLEDQGSEAHERLKKKWAGDSDWKQHESPKDENAETTPEANPSEDTGQETPENTEIGEDEDEENENDDDNTDDEEDEPKPEPKPASRRGRRVQATLLETVESAFTGIDLRSDIEKTIALVAKEVDGRKLRQATLSDQGQGTYAALKLHPSSARMLANWAKSQGVKKPFDPSYMHITTCYSKKAVDYKPLSFVHGGREVQPKALEFLGRDKGAANNEKTLVLLLNPGFPNRRFHYARAQGASHDFPDYKPHISIAPPGHGLDDVSDFDIGSINFPLIVDYEYSDVLSSTIPGAGVAVMRPTPVVAKRFSRSGHLQTEGGRTVHYKQGDVKIIAHDGEVQPIKASIFKARYHRLDDGRYARREPQFYYYRRYNNDYILSYDTGDKWTVDEDTFKRFYSIIVDKN